MSDKDFPNRASKQGIIKVMLPSRSLELQQPTRRVVSADHKKKHTTQFVPVGDHKQIAWKQAQVYEPRAPRYGTYNIP